MYVREATGDDVTAIRAVAEAAWEADYADILTRETATDGVAEWYGGTALRDAVESRGTLVLVASTDTEIAGFLARRRRRR